MKTNWNIKVLFKLQLKSIELIAFVSLLSLRCVWVLSVVKRLLKLCPLSTSGMWWVLGRRPVLHRHNCYCGVRHIYTAYCTYAACCCCILYVYWVMYVYCVLHIYYVLLLRTIHILRANDAYSTYTECPCSVLYSVPQCIECNKVCCSCGLCKYCVLMHACYRWVLQQYTISAFYKIRLKYVEVTLYNEIN